MDSEENLGERLKCRKMDRDINNLCMRFCPEGVSYIPLGEATEMQRGTSITKKNIIEGTVPVIAGGQKPAYYCDKANRDADIITVAGSGAYAGYVSYWDCPVFVSDAFSVKAKEGSSTKYIYYAMQNLQSEIYATKKGGGVPHVHISSIEKMRIPLPPLPIQQEIVRILDTFTNLTAELTAELTARRKQYEYYRDELLKTGEQVSLYEVAQYSKDRILASELTDENYVGVDNLLPNKQGKIKSEHTPIEGKFTGFVKGDILIGNIRPYLKKIWFSDCVGGTNGDVLTIRVIDKERVLPRFLYFALSTESFFNYDMNNAKGAKMPRGDKKAVMNYQFYLPSLEIQEKVVSILETFDNLCNGFEYGLPAEIYARQQQYEYYRDELLNFKELHNKED